MRDLTSALFMPFTSAHFVPMTSALFMPFTSALFVPFTSAHFMPFTSAFFVPLLSQAIFLEPHSFIGTRQHIIDLALQTGKGGFTDILQLVRHGWTSLDTLTPFHIRSR